MRISIVIAKLICILTVSLPALHLIACQRPPKAAASTSNYASTSVDQLTHFRTSGKVGYQQGNTGGQATFLWQQSGHDFTLKLFNPFGGEEAYLSYKNGLYELKLPNKSVEKTDNIEPLFRQELGWSAPVAHLSYWIRGIPLPNTPKRVNMTTDGARVLRQSNWTITYLRMTDVNNLLLPASILLERTNLPEGPVRLKMILHWD